MEKLHQSDAYYVTGELVEVILTRCLVCLTAGVCFICFKFISA